MRKRLRGKGAAVVSEWPVSQRFELSPDPGDRNLDVTQFTRQGGCVRAGDQAHRARAAGCGAGPGRGARLSAGLRTRFTPAPPTSHCCWPGSWGAGGGLCAAPRGFRPRGPLQRSGGKAQCSQGLQGDGPPDLRAQAVRARSPSPHPRRPALGSGVPPRGAETESQGEAGGPRRRGASLPPSHLSAGSTRQQTPKH